MEMKETETQPTSTSQEQPAVYQNAEVVTAQTPAGETGSMNVVGDSQGQVANDMAPAQSASAMPAAAAPVTAVVKKPTMTFAQFREKFLNQKIFNLVLFVLGIALVILSIFEFGHLALAFSDIYSEMIDAITGLNYWSFFQIIITLLALGTYATQIIYAIIALIKKGHKVRFDHVATPLAIAVLWKFFAKYNPNCFFCRTLNLGVFYEVILWTTLVYIIIRLFKPDWNKRLGGVVCSVIGVLLAIGIYMLTEDASFINMDFLNLSNDMEWKALLNEIADLPQGVLISLFMYFITGIFGALLPFLALSTIAYYLDVFAGDETRQYYSLRYAQRTSILMVVMQSISIALAVTCYFLCKSSDIVTCALDYKLLALTLILPIAMIVISWLPWKIHMMIYTRNCKKHDQLRGAK